MHRHQKWILNQAVAFNLILCHSIFVALNVHLILVYVFGWNRDTKVMLNAHIYKIWHAIREWNVAAALLDLIVMHRLISIFIYSIFFCRCRRSDSENWYLYFIRCKKKIKIVSLNAKRNESLQEIHEWSRCGQIFIHIFIKIARTAYERWLIYQWSHTRSSRNQYFWHMAIYTLLMSPTDIAAACTAKTNAFTLPAVSVDSVFVCPMARFHSFIFDCIVYAQMWSH